MLCWIIFAFFSTNLNCSYVEIEGISIPSTSEKQQSFDIMAGKYYWFEFENEVFLLHFDNKLETHENPFLVFILIEDAKSERWLEVENNHLLITAFDDFFIMSSFFSLLPNNENRKYYNFSVNTDYNIRLDGEIKLDGKKISITLDSILTELTNFVSVLQQVKIGTLFWRCFYKVENLFYELVLEGTYILYQENFENPNASFSFRIGNLVELSVSVFEVRFLKEKALLHNNSSFFKIYPKKYVQLFEKNAYRSRHFFTIPSAYIVFNFEENKNQQFQFVFERTHMNDEETDKPAIERLPHSGQRTYVFKNDNKKEVTIEIPTYYIGQKTELSLLLVSLKFIAEDSLCRFKRKHFFTICKYDFRNEENGFNIYASSPYYFWLSFTVENRNLVFRVTKVTDVIGKEYSSVSIGIAETQKGSDNKSLSTTLDGAAVYDERSTVVLTEKRTYKQEPNLEKCNKKHISYGLTCLILLIVCCSVGGTLFCFRKKHPKRKFYKKKTC